MAENNGTEKYVYLNRLSTEQLEELLRADFESTERGNTDAVFHILEVIEKREEDYPTGRLPDEDKSWEEFQQYYNILEGEGASLYPTEEEETATQPQTVKVVRLRPALKLAGIVAAIVVGIFGLMVTAQAAGVDVFGAMGRWTEETFRFVTSSSEISREGNASPSSSNDSNFYTSFQTALQDLSITEPLVPTWYPEGFIASELNIAKNDVSDNIYCAFFGTDDGFFGIQVRRYHLAADIDSLIFEKDNKAVQEYIAEGKSFFILSNLDSTTATWSDGNSLVWTIVGTIPERDIKAIIDSIGAS